MEKKAQERNHTSKDLSYSLFVPSKKKAIHSLSFPSPFYLENPKFPLFDFPIASMENHKRRFVTSSAATDDDDIITNFPEDLINPILERLPVKDAVRTSVLSKNWRYRWTTMRTLDLQYEFSGKFTNIGAYQHNGFVRIINHIMIHHQGPIKKFHLYIPKEIVLDSFQEVDHWMLILSRNNVRVLILGNSNSIYQLPSSVFSCLQLRVLVLYRCFFRPPFEFQGFPNLERITLKKVNFGGNLGGIVINLPQLNYLALHHCANVINFNIKAEKLRVLLVDSCPEAMLLQLLPSKHLYAVKICLSESFTDLTRVLSFSFTIDGHFLKIFAAERFSKWLPQVIKWIQHLYLQRFSFGDLDQLQGALCMLRNSPCLKVLRVTNMPLVPEADMGLTSNYLESLDRLDQTQFMLKNVEMTSLEGSRPELLFVKLILDRSPHLENMIIRPRATTDAQKILNIANEVMLFPRASTKAKIFYLDPVP